MATPVAATPITKCKIFTDTSDLRKADRCDSRDCNSRAGIKAVLNAYPTNNLSFILLCNTHYRPHEEVLTAKAIAIYDERERQNKG